MFYQPCCSYQASSFSLNNRIVLLSFNAQQEDMFYQRVVFDYGDMLVGPGNTGAPLAMGCRIMLASRVAGRERCVLERGGTILVPPPCLPTTHRLPMLSCSGAGARHRRGGAQVQHGLARVLLHQAQAPGAAGQVRC